MKKYSSIGDVEFRIAHGEQFYLADEVDAEIARIEGQRDILHGSWSRAVSACHDADHQIALMQRAVQWLVGLTEILNEPDDVKRVLMASRTLKRDVWQKVPADLAPIICSAKRGDGNG